MAHLGTAISAAAHLMCNTMNEDGHRHTALACSVPPWTKSAARLFPVEKNGSRMLLACSSTVRLGQDRVGEMLESSTIHESE